VGHPSGELHNDRPFAVIDIGSNSGRMIVFRLRENEHLDVVEDARAPLRLARDLRDSRELGEAAIARVVEALHDFRAVADGAGATRIVAVATSAVRDADDGHRLVEKAHRIGIPLQVIDGALEARLGFLGAVHDLPVADGYTMDVGGGSVELSRFIDRRLQGTWTLPLGSLRVSDRFLLHDPPSDKDLSKLRRHVASTLEGSALVEPGRGEIVGIGGTVRNLAKIDLRQRDDAMPLLHGHELSKLRLDEILVELATRTMKRRAQLPGLNPDRADTIVGGALVVQGVMTHAGMDRLVVSSRGLREGLALDAFDRNVPSAAWVRTISVPTLAARFVTCDADAAPRRAAIALCLFETLHPLAPGPVPEMLEHAATLIDIGRAIGYYDRFEHAAAIVVAADLAGFAHRDLAVLATILRGAADDRRDGPLARLLGESDRTAAERAAATLSLASELNRRIPPGDPAPISCSWRRDGFEVVAPVPPGWRPRVVAERFAEAFAQPLILVASEAAAQPAVTA
jgi:exopolyphosphatase/guanosine-5'-triphosphate,3'-diphosphate pyrophosphatase